MVINVLLLGFFAIPHSIFARPVVKKKLGETDALASNEAVSVYRSIYVGQRPHPRDIVIGFRLAGFRGC